MDSIVNEIIAIEQRAKNLVNETKQKAEQREAQISDNYLEIERDIMSRKTQRIKKIIKTEEARMTEEVLKVSSEKEKRLSHLSEKFSENKEKWEDDILKNVLSSVLGGDDS